LPIFDANSPSAEPNGRKLNGCWTRGQIERDEALAQ